MDNTQHQLTTYDNLWCEKGNIRILDFIGSGGQAEVYKVEIDGKKYALKYYFKENCSDRFKENLKQIIKKPINSKMFLWPLCLVEKENQFGYVMRLKPKGFYDITDWLADRVETSMETLIKICINLCEAFHNLHAVGYSYKDISNSNITFNPNTGEVLILDNDNVTPNLESSGVKGTSGFMAPELISGKAKTPSRLTDLFSLAVLLFQLLCCEHPLNGKKEYNMNMLEEDEFAIIEKLYGINSACFIFKDENNLDKYIEQKSQSQMRAKDLWQVYPEFIHNLFRRAFVDGIKNPHERPMSNEWVDAFVKLLSHLYTCPNCDYPQFFNKDEFKANKGKSVCKSCKHIISLPIVRLNTEDFVIINNDRVLYSGYFNLMGDKLQPIIKAKYKNGNLSFDNCSQGNILLNSIVARPGENTITISNNDKVVADGQATINVNNKEYMIAIPR